MKTATSLIVSLALVGCASTANPNIVLSGGNGRAHSGARLFVSPSGEPFRSLAGEPYPVVKWFARADTNSDRRLDKIEFRADAEQFFHLLDVDHDGSIGGIEVTRYETEIVPEMLSAFMSGRGEHVGAQSSEWAKIEPAMLPDAQTYERASVSLAQSGGGGGGGGGKRKKQPDNAPKRTPGPSGSPSGAAPYGLLGQPEPVATADRNFDGRITLGEFLSNSDRNFALLDAQSQGFLTIESLPRTRVQR